MFDRLAKKTSIDVNGCWNWVGATKGFGYGYTTIGSRKDGSRKTITTHRAMWIALNDYIPDGLWVLHHCDNPRCINPDHLYLGTRADNVRDRESRNRNVMPDLKHEDHPNAKLNWEKVKYIRKSCNKRGDATKLAKELNVNHKTISDVLLNKTWTPEPPNN